MKEGTDTNLTMVRAELYSCGDYRRFADKAHAGNTIQRTKLQLRVSDLDLVNISIPKSHKQIRMGR